MGAEATEQSSVLGGGGTLPEVARSPCPCEIPRPRARATSYPAHPHLPSASRQPVAQAGDPVEVVEVEWAWDS